MKLKKIFISLLCLCLLGTVALFSVNARVKAVAKPSILTSEQAKELSDIDCIIVLGCQVKADGTLSHMLRDRLTRGVELYKSGVAPKLLMSGDHGQKSYDEVNAMKQYAKDNGVPSENVFMDHAGFSTYETVYRAKEIFEAKKVVIVTQEYHLHRALYIAKQLGVEAYGVAADYNRYAGQTMRDFREILARNKDFAQCIFKPKPTYLGEAIPVSGNGDTTND
jgi:vancomycin permeability regulator SanA